MGNRRELPVSLIKDVTHPTKPDVHLHGPLLLSFNASWNIPPDDISGLEMIEVETGGGGCGTPGNLTIQKGTLGTSVEIISDGSTEQMLCVRAVDRVGNASEWASPTLAFHTVTKYYSFGGQTVAMRQGDKDYYIATDHLGSTSVLMDNDITSADKGLVAHTYYYPFGGKRSVQYGIGEDGLMTDRTYTGQREDTDLGLMDYNARFYSPLLGRFLSPDTYVPNPYNPLDWDRYAYVRNNPIKYNDPSGHSAKPGERGITDSWEGTPFSVAYNVIFRGKWSYQAMQTAMDTVKQVGSAISQAIYTQSGDFSPSSGAFSNAFGKLTFNGVGGDNICGGCLGQESYPEIKFRSEQISSRLIVHELGHAFEKAIYTRNGGRYTGTNNPIQFLVGNGIYDSNGNLVTGYDKASGSYTRWNGQSAPFNGFNSDRIPSQYHGLEFDDWNNVHEGFADIFLNWTFNSFAQNTAGSALYVWTATNMAEWVNSGR